MGDIRKLDTALSKELAHLKQIRDRLAERDLETGASIETVDNAVEIDAVRRSISMLKDTDFSPHLLHNVEH